MGSEMQIIVLGTVAFGGAYFLIPSFKKQVDAMLGGTKKPIEIPEEALPEGTSKPKPENPRTGCYASSANGKATTCFRQVTPNGKYVAWCVFGSDMCSFAKAQWCRQLSPNSASCKAILGSKHAFAYTAYNPTEDRISVS